MIEPKREGDTMYKVVFKNGKDELLIRQFPSYPAKGEFVSIGIRRYQVVDTEWCIKDKEMEIIVWLQ